MGSCLALDTSGSEHALVLVEDSRLLAQDRWPRTRGAGDPPILSRVQSLLDGAGRSRGDLEAIAAARGPGSFTGLRVGLAIASGIAYAGGLPLYLVDSLAVLRARSPLAGAALRDAGRGECFAWRPGSEPVRLQSGDLGAWLRPEERVVVDPPGRLQAWIRDPDAEVPEGELLPLPRALSLLTIEALRLQKPVRYHEVRPLYVQPAAAEERKASH
jgi:tRNA threonylcarbamoyl adenosine modification protein YeaZ